jgi:hypothetical protein
VVNQSSFNKYLKVGCFLLAALTFTNGQAEEKVWRLDQSIGVPDWMEISFEHRTRYESLSDQYRKTVNGVPGNGGDQVLVFRTLVHARADFDQFKMGVEIQDSRIKKADSGSASGSKGLTTTIANPLELLQAYIEVPFDDFLLEGSQHNLRAGRITMDLGTRRLVARNRYRNTINGFTGVDWKMKKGLKNYRLFYTMPVTRQVDGDIIDNNERFDEENSERRFWGLYYSQPLLSKADKVELFLLGLREEDSSSLQTKDRDLNTYGVRFWRKPKVETFDYQLEGYYQVGESSRSTSPAANRLDHKAYFYHLEMGYSFDALWSPRLIGQFDYASGDDSNDGDNNRFDTLFGARRFDYGPTSSYGAFARSNLQSPGLRLVLKPRKDVSAMFSLRGFWRASKDDAWTTSGISGDDSYIGTQIETRLRWDLIPKQLRLEGGLVYLSSGALMSEADKDDATYGYLQATFNF